MENETNQAVESQVSQDTTSVEKDVQAAPSPAESQSPAQSESVAQSKPQLEKTIPYSRFRESLSQRDNYASELKKAQELNQKYLEMLERQNPAKQQTRNLEQEQAAQQLEEILLNQPKFKGLMDKLNALEARTGDFTTSQTTSALDKEQDSLLKQCEKYGLDPTEVFGATDDEGNLIAKGEIQKYIESHPVLSKLGIQPGIPEIAFRAIYFEKQAELSERAANLKLINEQQAKKKATVQTQGSQASQGGRKESMEDYLTRRIEESGGIGN